MPGQNACDSKFCWPCRRSKTCISIKRRHFGAVSSHRAMEAIAAPGKLVCVTGAAGFIASWLVKLLLDRGYTVRGTVRDLSDESHTRHLTSLEGAKERLMLVKADLLNEESLVAAMDSCEGVFHTACPVLKSFKDPWTEMLEPAVKGTINVIQAACNSLSVKRVVMTSSIGTVYMDPANRTRDLPLDESCWSNTQHLLDSKEWYCLAKTLAEKAAWECAAGRIELVTVVPPLVLGPVLEPRVNASSMHVVKYLSGCVHTYANLCQAYVDVRDVAWAHVLVLESESASGRYFCVQCVLHRGELVEAIARLCPLFPLPKICSDPEAPKAVPLKFCTKKIEQLGLEFVPFERCLADSIKSYQEKGLLEITDICYHST